MMLVEVRRIVLLAQSAKMRVQILYDFFCNGDACALRGISGLGHRESNFAISCEDYCGAKSECHREADIAGPDIRIGIPRLPGSSGRTFAVGIL